MLFDEPASGLDPLTAAQVLDLIIRARDVYGISSIYVTKKLDEIPYLANRRATRTGDQIVIEETTRESCPRTRVMVLARGQIIFTGSSAKFQASTPQEVTRLNRG